MRSIPALGLLASAILLAAGCSLAQQTPAPSGPAAAASGAVPCCGPGYGPEPSPGGGPSGRGPMMGGPGGGGGPMMGAPRVGSDYTPGWSMMTPAERDEHRQRMFSAKTPEECRQIVEEHRKLMTERAKSRGIASMPGPRHDACAAGG